MKASVRVAWFFLLASVAHAQEARAFEVKMAQGEKWVVNSERVLDLDLTIADPDQKETKKNARTVVQQQYTREATKVDAKVLAVRLHFSKDRTNAEKGPLEDLDVIVDGAGGTLRAESPQRALTAEEKASFRVEEDFQALLPDHPVAKGEKWDLDVMEVARFVIGGFVVAPQPNGHGECKLTDIRKEGESEVATIYVTIEFRGRSRDGWEMASQLEGTLVFDATRGRPASLTLHGKVTADGRMTDPKGELLATVAGNGTLNFTSTYGVAR